MPATSEVLARLGLDISDVPKDLADAQSFFKKFGKQIEGDSAKAGTGAGSKFAKSFSAQMSGQARGAIVAALGLSAQGIVDKIAGWLTGGTKAEWEEFGRIADENSKAIGERIRENLSAKRIVDNLTNELEAAKARTARAQDVGEAVNGGGKIGAVQAVLIGLKAQLGFGEKEVYQRLAVVKAKADELAIEKELTAAKKAQGDMEGRYFKALRDYEFELSTLDEKRKTLAREIVEINADILAGGLSEKEVQERKIDILQKDIQLRGVVKQIAEETAEAERKAADKKKKDLDEETKKRKDLANLGSKRAGIEEKIGDAQVKAGDRSKASLGELASFSQFGVGVSSDAGAAGAKARDILEIERQANEARMRGDVSGAEEGFTRAGALRNDLVKSGFAKSTEGDPQDEVVKEINKLNTDLSEVLEEIRSIEEKKYVSQ